MSNAAASTPVTADVTAPISVQSLPLPAAVIFHTPTLVSLFVRMAQRVVMTRAYCRSTNTVTLTFACDPQSDYLSRDERAVMCEAKAMLIYLGFYVKEIGEMRLVLDGYYGTQPKPVQDVVPVQTNSEPEPVPLAAPTVQVLPAACLQVPRETFPRHYVERWSKGPAANARVRSLRSEGMHVTTCSRVDSKRLWNEPGADRASLSVVEIAYILPRGAAPPAVPVYERGQSEKVAA